LFTTASTTKGKMSRQLKGFEAKRVVGKGKNQRQIKVQLLVTTVGDKQSVPMVHEPYNITKIKKPTKIYGNYLPSDFEVSGLPCKIVFRLDKVKTFADSYSMQITHITFDCPNGLQSSDIPIDLIRTLAVKASAFVAEVTPANTRIDHSPGNYTVTGSEGGFVVLGHAGVKQETEKAFVGTRPTGEDLYKQIGYLYSTLPHGSKHKLIMQAFGRSLAWAHKHTAIGAKEYPQYFKGYKQKPKQKKGKKTK